MDIFIFRPTAWPPFRALSRNPLVRPSDRIESLVITVSVFVVLVATACAGALGTMVHDTSVRTYAEQARARHLVVATVLERSHLAPASPIAPFVVPARWEVNGVDHADGLGSQEAVDAGDPLPIWVDDAGNPIGPPSPASRAVTDGVTVAIVAWLSVILAVTGWICWVQRGVNRMRNAEWERDIRCLVGDDDGRTNSSP